MSTPCYVGFCTGCGHMVAAVVDEPRRSALTARDVAGFIRSGLRVERATDDEVRAQLHRCTCKPSPGKAYAQVALGI